MINPIESTISSDDFANWLDGVSYSTCTIVIDTCHAAAFIPDLSKENRIILAGATGLSLIADNVEQTAHRLPFSKILYKTLSSGVSYGEAWMTADQYIYEATGPLGFPVYRNNNPQIDDNGDGKGHGTILPNTLPLDGDGGLALKTYP